MVQLIEVLDINLSDEDFDAFARLVHEKAGIFLHRGKKELVRARLVRRIRELEFDGFRKYLDYIVSDQSGDELVHMLDSISTNITHFFREQKHFDFMVQVLLPELADRKRKKGQNRLRIWSAGCSTGEEPYSIVIDVLEHSAYFSKGDFKVLGTDLSTNVLSVAKRGIYQADHVKDVPQPQLKKYFQKGRGQWDGWFRVKDSLKRKVAFRHLNLMNSFPFKQPFDLIFCRNVMIYFDKPTQTILVNKFHQNLALGGYLFIGHSESLTRLDHSYKYIQPTVYKKVENGGKYEN